MLAQVAEGSQAACQAACRQLLPQLAAAATNPSTQAPSPSQQAATNALTQAGASPPHSTQHLALSAILPIVKAAAKLAATGACQQDPMGNTAPTILAAVCGHLSDQTQSQQQEPQAPLEDLGHLKAATRTAAKLSTGNGTVTGQAAPSLQDSMQHDSVDCGSAGPGAAGSSIAVQDQSLKQLAGSLKQSSKGSQHTTEDSDSVQLLQLQVLTELVSFPRHLKSLAAEVSNHLVACVTHASPELASFPVGWGQSWCR